MNKFFTFFFIIYVHFLSAQDPAYTDFDHSRMIFNPSLVGSSGAESLKFRSKFQWNNDGGDGYKTGSILFEEAMPCSIVDIGLKFNFNEEGKGVYRTIESGILTSACLPFSISPRHSHNFKFGFDFSWGVNTIDFSRLIWSDQLDKKYGIVRHSSFVSQDGNRSAVYFNPGIGFSLKSVWNKKSSKAIVTNFGFATYRFYSFRSGEINQSVSILGLNNSNPYRLTAFVQSEFIPRIYEKKYMTVRPLVLFQKQGNLNYMEAGARLGYLKTTGIGFYFHTVPFVNSTPTSWLTIKNDYLFYLNKKRIMELNLNYSTNFGGLKNFVGPIFEIGLSFHFAKSSICNKLGKEDDVPYDSNSKCPIMSISPGKRKIYENIWYKN